MPSTKTYDVVIVGSGAGGGVAAQVLAEAGARICMLEAGDWFDCTRQSMMFGWPYNAPHRAASSKAKPFGYFDATLVGGWEVPGEPYVNAPGSTWRWWRARMLGGRTNHYGRISLRMGPYDFKPYSRDGKGFDWPITYDDLAPYYDKAEELIGVFGSAENLENTPDGKFLPPPAPRGYERVIKHACDKLKIPCIPSRMAMLTRPLNGRPACHYCGQCGRSCGVNANFSSPGVHIFPTLKKTNVLEVRTNAMVRAVNTGPDGLATGVTYVDKKTRQDVEVRAKIVVLAASCCETARILLNSKDGRHPNGVANSSGLVGRYIMDTVGSAVSGHLPILEDLPPQNEDGIGGMHLYMPWWLYREQLQNKLPFARGYHIEIGGGRDQPGAGVLYGAADRIGGYGVELKQKLRKVYGAEVSFAGRGEMIPNDNSYCEIDPTVVDQWGIPVLRFHFKWSDDEILQARHMQETFQEIIETAGGYVTYKSGASKDWGIAPGGEIIHEVGATKMGTDPKSSVLNQYAQAWDCKNLFVTDAAPFVSNADKNPTLTISALGWRTSDYIVDQVKKLNVKV